MAETVSTDVLGLTVQIVAAHVGHNDVAADVLPALIQSVYQALSKVNAEPEAETSRPSPAVPIRRSVFPDYLVCLEDGAKMKMLKRYIEKRFGLTPAAYRERWGLPADYPMVAPNYAQRRSDLAREIGLGRRAPAEQPVEDVAEVEKEAAIAKEPKSRTRRKSPVVEAEN